MVGNEFHYIPKKCVFEATLGCNLRCRHCGSRAGIPRPNELDTDEVRDLFRQLAALGCQWVTIAGGEPMARHDWPEVIDAVTRAGIRAGMLTNGIAFDEDAARLAKDKGLNAVGFSLDGLRDAHDRIRGKVGHFERLMKAMNAATAVGLPFSVVSFVNTLNIGHLEEMHDLICHKGAYAWQLQMGTDMGNLHDNPELLLKPRQLPRLQRDIGRLIHRGKKVRIDVSDSIGYYGPAERILRTNLSCKSFNGCRAGQCVIGIESNGNVKGCLSVMAGYNEKGESFVEGNIREESLSDIWQRPGGFSYTREWKIDDLSGFCRECRYASRCRGGCTAKKVASGAGTENPMCAYRVICEEQEVQKRAGRAAAAVLAGLLGVSAESCDKVDDDKADSGVDAGQSDSDTVLDYGIQDPDIDIDTDTDTDTDTDADSDTDTDTDTDSDMDSETVVTIDTATDYGMPDYGFEEYAMPPYGFTDTDTDTDKDVMDYGIQDPDTPVLEYGVMPPSDSDPSKK